MSKTTPILLSLAALAGLGGLALERGASAQSEAAPSVPSQEIVKLYGSGTRTVAMLTLGDGPPAPVVFDTGTDTNLLTEAYFKALGLHPSGSSTMTDAATGKSMDVPVTTLAQPRLGGVPLVVSDAQIFESGEPDMVGIFGPGSFAGRLVTLELGMDRLRLSPLAGRAPSAVGTPYRNGLPALDINVAGVTLSAHLDSGNTGALSVSRAMMGKIPLKAPPTIVGTAVSVLGQQDIYGGQVNGIVAIGPLRLKDPEVEFSGIGAGANIGFGILNKLILVMDPAGQRSWVLDPRVDLPLASYVGQFGVRAIRVEKGKLIHQRTGRPPIVLTPLGSGLFENAATGDRMQFVREGNRVTGLELITSGGDFVSYPRDK